jgi:ubiquitin-like modifier-activating enzyme ATG7
VQAISLDLGTMDLTCVPFRSHIDPSFWIHLYQQKVKHWKLDEPTVPILGYYVDVNEQHVTRSGDILPPSFFLSDHSFLDEKQADTMMDQSMRAFVAKGRLFLPGIVKNFNTLQSYHSFDKKDFFRSTMENLMDEITSGRIFECPEKLCSFVLLCFADLKSFKYTYVFGFPCLSSAQYSLHTIHPAEQLLSSYEVGWTI